MEGRLGPILLAVGAVGISAFGALIGLVWGFGLKCDDACSTVPGWRNDPDAWQWDAFGALASPHS